jgi:two-component system sensor histidine kinase DegS
MCYDDNVFNPNYEDTEIKYRMKRLEEEKESISNQIESYTQELEHINVKIDEIYNLVNKSIDKEYQNQVVCCSESEKYKIDILRSQEFERKRIARDLHDTVVQNLTNLIHKAELTLKVMDFDPIRAKLELMSITKNTREIIDEIRNIIYDLRPMAFDDIGIDVIIERKLSEIREIGVLVKYEVEGEIGEVDQIVLLTLIRIVGEACNNTLKHGKANKIEVKLRYLENFIEIYIKDDGIGFNMKDDMNINYESKSGFGLSMMRERVYLLSGIITFTSKENEGTEIYVKVPKCFKEES